MKTEIKSPIPFRVISLISLLLWMGLIFYLSGQNADESSGLSNGFTSSFIRLFFPDISEETLYSLSLELQFAVRKGAHFTAYATLGFLSFLSVVTYTRLSLAARTSVSLIIGLLYSVSDEYHQTFIDGRSGELRDVCIDFSGVLLAVAVCRLILYLRHKKRKRVPYLRKRQYVELVETLRQELHKARLAVDELKEENSALADENENLSDELRSLKKQIADMEAHLQYINESECVSADGVPDPGNVTKEELVHSCPEDQITNEINLPDEVEYGSDIIGKIVLLAAEYCGSLSAESSGIDTKELINLILGRTEVAKAEILKITGMKTDSQSKTAAMDKELRDAEDYFKSVVAQKL